MEVIAEARRYIATFHIDQWQDGHPHIDVLREDIRKGIGYVLDEDGVVAYAALRDDLEPFYATLRGTWLTDGTPYATVHRMGVCDRVRHTGAAWELMAQLEETAKAKGMASVRVDTHRGNLAMNAFLKKHGYTYCGEVDYTGEVLPGHDPIRVAYEKK